MRAGDARTTLLLLFLVLGAAAVLLCTAACAPQPAQPPAPQSSSSTATTPPPPVSSAPATTTGAALPVVARVIDGDTLVLTDDRRVRLLGIDAPEKGRCYADEATEALRALAPAGAGLTLTADPTQSLTDRYGRTLAYLEVPATGTADVALQLLTEGAARTYVYDRKPVTRDPAYEAAQTQARAAGAGLWGVCGVFPTA